MRYMTRFILILMALVVALPVMAQDTTTIDPDGDFTETFTLDTVTIRYPLGMIVSENSSQISLAFNEDYTDYITIAPPDAFEAFGIPAPDLVTASDSVYNLFATQFGDLRTPEEALIADEVGGIDAYSFEMTNDADTVVAYIFETDGQIFAVTLITRQQATDLQAFVNPTSTYNDIKAVEVRIMLRIIESMTIDGVAIAQPVAESTEEPVSIVIEATSEPTDFETRPAPTDVVEVDQEVTLLEGDMTFFIPSDWVIDETAPRVLVANVEVAVVAMAGEEAIGEDEIVLQMISPSLMSSLPIEEITPLTVMNTLVSQYTDVVIYEYDELPFAVYYAPITGLGEGVPAGAFILTFGVGDGATAVIVGVADDFDAYEATVFSIINSIVYTPIETETEE